MRRFFTRAQSQPSNRSEPEARRRNLAIRIHFITGLLLTLAATPSLLTLAPEATLNYIGNIITMVMGLIAFASAWISFRHSHIRGSLLFTAALLLISLGIPFYANGLGLQAGIIVAMIVISVAATTLPPPYVARVSIIGVLVEVAVVLMDLYLPDLGLEKLQSQNVNPFLVIILLVFAYFVFRQYSNYTFRAKLILFLVVVTVIAVSTVAIGTNTLGIRELTNQAGLNVAELANRLADDLGSNLSTEVDSLRVAGTQFEESAATANEVYAGKSQSQILNAITALDEEWRAADDNNRLVRGVLENEYAAELREFQEIAPQHVELFITDRYGANIAATNRTSDYYQADEDWWQASYSNGDGAIFISQPEFDESSNTYAVLMAIPLYHEEEVVGILRSTLDVTALSNLLTEDEGMTSAQANLRISPDQFLTASLSPEDAASLGQIAGDFGQINMQGIPSLVSERNIVSSDTEETHAAINNLQWSIVVYQDLNESLALIEDQTRTTITLALLITLLTVLAGYFVSLRLAAPIVNLTAVTSEITRGNVNARAEVQTQDEIGALSASFNLMNDQLQATLHGLEQRVIERTAEMNNARLESERRAQDLQSISEISRIVSGERRSDILLPLISRLVSEKFGYYHTGIFLLDESKRFAVLQAANSEGGQRMLNRGHRLELGKGIVGTVAETGTPRIAQNVGDDAVYFDNLDLPTTRSEAAIPLSSAGQTIGVLDVQSTRAGEFTENTLNVLSILADQIAIAIENARLFASNEKSLQEAQALYNQYLQKEWKALKVKATNVGYQQSLRGGNPVETPVESDEIRNVLQRGELMVMEENGSRTEPSIVVPIKLRGQTIGVMRIKSPVRDRKWSREEIAMIESVSERLALALENARLFEETTRRAEREKLVSDITGKIRNMNDPQAMIALAAEELRNVLGASRVQVIPQKTSDEKENGKRTTGES